MASDFEWRLAQGIREQAVLSGEAVALARFGRPPVDPLTIIADERLIFARGADFGEAFDGRLEYQRPRFLLFYNTKYDGWKHDGPHHPKTLFAVAHELGHYFIDEHREYLRRGGGSHRSFAEFRADGLVEQQADHFAAGLLMPRELLGPVVNEDPEPTLDDVRAASALFRVSLTAMLLRWPQVSHFPCATVCVGPSGLIKWGFVSEGFRGAHAYRSLRNTPLRSADARRFLAADASCSTFRQGSGRGYANHWVEIERNRVSVTETYVTIPHRTEMFAFVAADERELYDSVGDD